MILPGERPVVISSVAAEVARVGARKGFSGTLPVDVRVIPENPDVILRALVRQQLRAFGASEQKIDVDAAVGATALGFRLPLITNDDELINAVMKLGGNVRQFLWG